MSSRRSRFDGRTASGREASPAGELPNVLRSAVAGAVLAPSEHHTQPWLFAIRGGAVWLYADRTPRRAVAEVLLD